MASITQTIHNRILILTDQSESLNWKYTMGDRAKRGAERRKYDQSSDAVRHARNLIIEKNLVRDMKKACDAYLKKEGLAQRSWYGNDSNDDDL